MDNTDDILKNYRGKYSQYWIERWGLIPELPTSFDNANSIYELVAWLQRAFKNLLDDFQQVESEFEDFKNALVDLLEYLIPELIRRYHDSAEFRAIFIAVIKDILSGEERTWVKDLLKELIEIDMREWIEDYLKDLYGLELNETNAQLAKNTHFVNVKNYLCDDGQYVQGDGIHDDTTGIQKALNEGLEVYFPRGTYLISETIKAGLPSQRIKGVGYYNSVIKPTKVFADDFLFELNGQNTPAYRSDHIFDGLGLDGLNSVGGLHVVGNADFKIINSRFIACTKGVSFLDSLIYSLDNCTMVKCDIGVYFEGADEISPSNIAIFNSCRIIGNQVAISMPSNGQLGANVVFDGCEIEANGQDEVKTNGRPTIFIRSTQNFGTNNTAIFRDTWFEGNENPNTFEVYLGDFNNITFDSCAMISYAGTQDRFMKADGLGKLFINNCADNSQYRVHTLETLSDIVLVTNSYGYESISVENIDNSIIHDYAQNRYVSDLKIYGKKVKLRAVGGSGYSEIWNNENDLQIDTVTGNLRIQIPDGKWWGSANSGLHTRPLRIGNLYLWSTADALYCNTTMPTSVTDGTLVIRHK